MRLHHYIVAVALSAFLVAPAIARETERCAAITYAPVVLEMPFGADLSTFRNLPHGDHPLWQRLHQPRSVEVVTYNYSPPQVILQYEATVNPVEIAARIRQDSGLWKTFSIQDIHANDAHGSGVCFSVWPPLTPATQFLREYLHVPTGHFRLLQSTGTGDDAVSRGEFGPGWFPTGEAMRTHAIYGCHGSAPVYSFERPTRSGPSSSFLTGSPEECGFVNRRIPQLQFNGTAFGIYRPHEGTCQHAPQGSGLNALFPLRPVYRLYNNRHMHDDSNHRYVAREALYQEMIAKGWVGEGIAFCVLQ